MSSVHRVSPCISKVGTPYSSIRVGSLSRVMPDRRCVAFGQHEIAVAVHEIHRGAGIDQCLELARSIVRNLFIVVVANPGFEQVTQNVERIRTGNVFLQKAKKTPGSDRAFVSQVQVGNKVGATCLTAWSPCVQTISALVMTTSSNGTS